MEDQSPVIQNIKNQSTPPWYLKLGYQVLGVLSVIWACFVEPVFTNIPVSVAHRIDQMIIAGGATIYAICQKFGWKTPPKGPGI